MSWPDLLQVAGLTLAITLAVGGCRDASAPRAAPIVADRAGGDPGGGGPALVVLSIVGASALMYISEHDLTVALHVAAISSVVSLALAAALGAVVVRNARALARGPPRSERERSWMRSAASPAPS